MTAAEQARYLVNRAIKDGDIVRGPCQVPGCPRQPTDAHHDDYERPLDVRFLCRMHHLLLHREGVTA